MGLLNEVVHPSDSNHVTINSFGEYERQRYQPIGNAVKELVRDAIKATGAELKQPAEGR